MPDNSLPQSNPSEADAPPLKADAGEVAAMMEAAEAQLGDPWSDDAAIAFSELMECDEREVFPVNAFEAMNRAGQPLRMIPEAYGGTLYSCHESLLYSRTLARRDLVLAAAGLLPAIGYLSVMIAGSEEQRRSFADFILRGGGMSWGISERNHGSDVISNECRAERRGDTYHVTGHKWPIGFGDRSEIMVVHARTAQEMSPTSHSLIAVDMRKADRMSYSHRPIERLYGVRSLPLGWVEFNETEVDPANVIGREGDGLQIVLRTHQALRTGVAAIALGAADTGLRIAMGFARDRRIFGNPLVGLPLTRRQLADAFADIFTGEIMVTGASRALHYAPKRMYLLSSLVKFTVPTTMERLMGTLSVLIGARYYLRFGFAKGVFQKVLRDLGMTGFVDGNTIVNLRVVGNQMPLAFEKTFQAWEEGLSAKDSETLRNLYDPGIKVPPPKWTKLDLQNNGTDLAFMGLADALRHLEGHASPRALACGRELMAAIRDLAERWRRENERLGRKFLQSAEFYDIAEQYCLLNAAAACVQYADVARDSVPEALRDVDWLAYCVNRILQRFDPYRRIPTAEEVDDMFRGLERLYDENRAFSTIAYRYAGEAASLSELGLMYE